MELATPDIEDLKNFIKDSYLLSCDLIEENLNEYKDDIKQFVNSYSFRFPFEKIRKFSQSLDFSTVKINNAIEKKMNIVSNKIALVSKSLEAHDIEKSLKKGFALIKQNAKFVTRKKNYSVHNPVTIKFYDGELEIK